MSSTITTARVAAAVRTDDGRTLYLLFEESYCSNVSPRTPSWCCMGIGCLPAIMERIFMLASSCEGGMLKNPSGRMTPEGYIGTWLKELSNPLTLHRTDVHLAVGDGWRAFIPEATLATALDLLTSAGRADRAHELRTSRNVTLSLKHDTDALLALQIGLQFEPWRFVTDTMRPAKSGQRDIALGYDPRPSPMPKLDIPHALKLNGDVRLERTQDGEWECGGWEYSIVGQYVRDLWQGELTAPGHHRKRIVAFRNAFSNAPLAPPGIIVEIDASKTTERYQRERIEEIRAEAGDPPGVFRVPVTDANEYRLTNLPRACARWLLPSSDQAAPTNVAELAL